MSWFRRTLEEKAKNLLVQAKRSLERKQINPALAAQIMTISQKVSAHLQACQTIRSRRDIILHEIADLVKAKKWVSDKLDARTTIRESEENRRDLAKLITDQNALTKELTDLNTTYQELLQEGNEKELVRLEKELDSVLEQFTAAIP